MRTILAGCLLVWLSGSSFGQEEKPLCPRHIETPGYPQIARVAHVEGILTLAVTIDADGNVTDAEVTNDDKRAGVALLKRFAILNVELGNSPNRRPRRTRRRLCTTMRSMSPFRSTTQK